MSCVFASSCINDGVPDLIMVRAAIILVGLNLSDVIPVSKGQSIAFSPEFRADKRP